MNLLLLLACALPLAGATSQAALAQTTPFRASTEVYTYAEQMPALPAGGEGAAPAIAVAIKRLVAYPAAAIRDRAEGRVFVSFVVTAEGQVQQERIIRGVRPDLDSAVLAAVRQLPRLVPGRQAGQAVAVQISAPVTFRLPPAADPAAQEPEKVLGRSYTYVEQMPRMPGGGGSAALVAAIQREVKYPREALRLELEGRVFVTFTVGPTGEVSNAKIVKGIGAGCDEAVLAAVQRLPRLQPGTQNGTPVTVSFTVPITFTIDKTPPPPSPRPNWPSRIPGPR